MDPFPTELETHSGMKRNAPAGCPPSRNVPVGTVEIDQEHAFGTDFDSRMRASDQPLAIWIKTDIADALATQQQRTGHRRKHKTPSGQTPSFDDQTSGLCLASSGESVISFIGRPKPSAGFVAHGALPTGHAAERKTDSSGLASGNARSGCLPMLYATHRTQSGDPRMIETIQACSLSQIGSRLQSGEVLDGNPTLQQFTQIVSDYSGNKLGIDFASVERLVGRAGGAAS